MRTWALLFGRWTQRRPGGFSDTVLRLSENKKLSQTFATMTLLPDGRSGMLACRGLKTVGAWSGTVDWECKRGRARCSLGGWGRWARAQAQLACLGQMGRGAGMGINAGLRRTARYAGTGGKWVARGAWSVNEAPVCQGPLAARCRRVFGARCCEAMAGPTWLRAVRGCALVGAWRGTGRAGPPRWPGAHWWGAG